MPESEHDPAMMICYRECLANLEKFNGDGEQKILQFLGNIERTGNMIKANDNILYCMCTSKLIGEAKRWYDDNTKLTTWETLKPALLERFSVSDSSSKIFEQLKERKQKADETITSYYDAIKKLCHEYDSSMSQKMMISWLENGIKDSLKVQIKRQMKSLSETARTTEAFLKIAKDEQELQEENSSVPDSTSPYAPYFTNTVSTTLPQMEDTRLNIPKQPYPPYPLKSHDSGIDYQQRGKLNAPRRPPPRTYPSTSQYDPSAAYRSQSSTFVRDTQRVKSEQAQPGDSSNMGARRLKPCSICQRNNHRTIDCYYRKQHGCYKCGQSDHRIRDCPEVFY